MLRWPRWWRNWLCIINWKKKKTTVFVLSLSTLFFFQILSHFFTLVLHLSLPPLFLPCPPYFSLLIQPYLTSTIMLVLPLSFLREIRWDVLNLFWQKEAYWSFFPNSLSCRLHHYFSKSGSDQRETENGNDKIYAGKTIYHQTVSSST